MPKKTDLHTIDSPTECAQRKIQFHSQAMAPRPDAFMRHQCVLGGNSCKLWLGDGVSRHRARAASMWRVLPNQTGGLQGLHHVSGDGLAVEKLGIGSGWQQSRQNWLPPAVMGYWT